MGRDDLWSADETRTGRPLPLVAAEELDFGNVHGLRKGPTKLVVERDVWGHLP